MAGEHKLYKRLQLIEALGSIRQRVKEGHIQLGLVGISWRLSRHTQRGRCMISSLVGRLSRYAQTSRSGDLAEMYLLPPSLYSCNSGSLSPTCGPPCCPRRDNILQIDIEVNLDKTKDNDFVIVSNKEDNYFIRNYQDQVIVVPRRPQDTIKDFPYQIGEINIESDVGHPLYYCYCQQDVVDKQKTPLDNTKQIAKINTRGSQLFIKVSINSQKIKVLIDLGATIDAITLYAIV